MRRPDGALSRALSRLGRNLSHHRAQVLLLMGVACVCRAYTVLSGTEDWGEDAAVFFTTWPSWVRVDIWVAAGLIAVVAAFWPRLRTAGYIAIGAAIAQRLAGHLWSFAMWVLPGPPGGDPYALAWSGWWASLLYLVSLAARWTKQDERRQDEVGRTGERE